MEHCTTTLSFTTSIVSFLLTHFSLVHSNSAYTLQKHIYYLSKDEFNNFTKQLLHIIGLIDKVNQWDWIDF
jgi:hypothetical protein